MKQIKLINVNKFAIVDDDQYDKLASKRLYYNQTTGQVMVADTEALFLHIFLFGKAPPGFQWDHINRNKLDARRENLRIATQSQNKANQIKFGGIYSSRFKGVTWDKWRNKWQARIKKDGKIIHLGRFMAEEDAARAYDKAAIEHFGEFAAPNFPSRPVHEKDN